VYALFASGLDRTRDIEEHMDGNLCRCTGYRPIWDAAKSLCSDSPRGPCGTVCSVCPDQNQCEMPCNATGRAELQEAESINSAENDVESWDMVVTSSTNKFKEEHRLGEMKCYDGTEFKDQPDNMFPVELLTRSIENSQEHILVVGERSSWFKPSTLTELLHLLEIFPGSKIVVGATEVGIETKFKNAVYPRIICPSNIPELSCFIQTKEALIIGSCTPLSVIQHHCEKLSKEESFSGYRASHAISNMLRWFASVQIRNIACLGGNLVTASPISDMNPMLAALGATLNICSASRPPRTVLVSDFFISYRKVDLNPDEVILSITIPNTCPVFEYIMPFKQARRREDDISIVTAGIRMKVSPSKDSSHFIIAEASLSFGGVAAKTILALNTAKGLIGKPWTSETFSFARKQLVRELDLRDDAPGGQTEYRRALAASFLFKFYLSSSLEISKDVNRVANNDIDFQEGSILSEAIQPRNMKSADLSGATYFLSSEKPKFDGTQIYPTPKITAGVENSVACSASLPISMKASEGDALGITSHHVSAELHCTGEAIYVDDIPTPPGLLHSALILSNRCNCRFTTVDKGKALLIPDVVGIFLYEDLIAIGGDNKLGPILKDEEIFATDEIRHVGMVIGIVVAETLEAAIAAARTVQVSYADIIEDDGSNSGPIISIEDAIEANSFYEFTHRMLEAGNVVNDFSNAYDLSRYVNVSGEIKIGSQEHFYMECNSTLVVPDETGLIVYSSTQAPTKTQMVCASATNTPSSKVVCKVKRMGGGFGGKETRSVFAAAACSVAAKITRRPVKINLDRNLDMAITGQRHAFFAKYKACASFDPNDASSPAKLLALDVEIFSNGGCSLDLSLPVLDRALFHIDNVYKWNSLRARGVVCKTAQPPHTAFRGFGGPQGLFVCEHVVDHLISALPISHQDYDSIRRANFYKEGEYTPFGMQISNWNVPTAWDMVCSSKYASVTSRRDSVTTFNATNRWKKRGMAVTPTKFGIAFTAKFMNQGGSLVHLYQDGTVLVTHGGTEMGQGLHTKVAQVAAYAFGIPLSSVFVNETATDKVSNTIPTAASMSTDLYGMATLNACREILERIQPIKDILGSKATLAEVATAAFYERIDLSAHGFYKLDDSRCGYNWDMPKDDHAEVANRYRGQPFNYFTQGVAVSEVEIDILTGDYRTIRSDIVVDVGSSLNPAIDVGQIEGAFVQGIGWSTVEELIWGDGKNHVWVKPAGRLFTQGPGTYKIPAFNDTPETFNVTLMDAVNPFAIHSSRAIGEPPFFLGTSVFFAIKDAIRSARIQELGEEGRQFILNLPATSERIRMSCGDTIARDCAFPQIEDESLKKSQMLGFQTKGSF